MDMDNSAHPGSPPAHYSSQTAPQYHPSSASPLARPTPQGYTQTTGYGNIQNYMTTQNDQNAMTHNHTYTPYLPYTTEYQQQYRAHPIQPVATQTPHATPQMGSYCFDTPNNVGYHYQSNSQSRTPAPMRGGSQVSSGSEWTIGTHPTTGQQSASRKSHDKKKLLLQKLRSLLHSVQEIKRSAERRELAALNQELMIQMPGVTPIRLFGSTNSQHDLLGSVFVYLKVFSEVYKNGDESFKREFDAILTRLYGE